MTSQETRPRGARSALHRAATAPIAALLLLAGASRCAGKVDDGVGSETHFVSCEVTSDCVGALGAGHECVAGKCEKVEPHADAGDADASDTDASNTQLPPECVVGSSEPGPYGVTFRYTNERDAPIAMWEECGLKRAVLSCADAYSEPLSTSLFCAPECPATNCPVCGACMSEPKGVTAAAPIDEEWTGERFVAGATTAGCTCFERHAVPAGKYRVSVDVRPSQPPDAPMGGPDATALYTVTVDFTLPDDDGIVEIPLDASPHVVPCADAGSDATTGGSCIERLDPSDPAASCSPQVQTAEVVCTSSTPNLYLCEGAVPLVEGCTDPFGGYGPAPGSSLEGAAGAFRCCP